jgi:hypothetical protein
MMLYVLMIRAQAQVYRNYRGLSHVLPIPPRESHQYVHVCRQLSDVLDELSFYNQGILQLFHDWLFHQQIAHMGQACDTLDIPTMLEKG